MKKTFWCLALLLLVSCQQEEVINIGVMGPFTGPVAPLGKWMNEGIDLAVEEINAEGMHGKQVQFIYIDTRCNDVKAAVSGLSKLQTIDNVKATIGPFCGTTNKVTTIMSAEEKWFMISPGDNLNVNSPYKVNTRYKIEKEATLWYNHAIQQGWTKMAIIYYNNDWGKEYRDVVNNLLTKDNNSFVADETYTWDNIDVRTQLLKIKEAKPDVLLVVDGTFGEIFNQISELGLTMPIISEWEITSDVGQERAPNTRENAILFIPLTQHTEVQDRFRERYNKSMNLFNIDSYDAMMIMAEALRTCPEYDAACMAEYVTSLENYQGAGGTLTFNKTSWSFDKPMQRHVIQGGVPVPS